MVLVSVLLTKCCNVRHSVIEACCCRRMADVDYDYLIKFLALGKLQILIIFLAVYVIFYPVLFVL